MRVQLDLLAKEPPLGTQAGELSSAKNNTWSNLRKPRGTVDSELATNLAITECNLANRVASSEPVEHTFKHSKSLTNI